MEGIGAQPEKTRGLGLITFAELECLGDKGCLEFRNGVLQGFGRVRFILETHVRGTNGILQLFLDERVFVLEFGGTRSRCL